MNQQTILLVGVIAVSVVGFAIFMIYNRKKNPTAKNNRPRAYGVGAAIGPLRHFARSYHFPFLAPVPLAGAQVDAVVVGEFGIMAVKAYGYNGNIYGTANEKEWLRVGYEDTRETFPNPILEANRDVQALRGALQKSKYRSVPIEVVVVFTHPKAELAVGRNSGVLTVKELKKLVGKEKYQQNKGVDPEKVMQALQEAMEGKTEG